MHPCPFCEAPVTLREAESLVVVKARTAVIHFGCGVCRNFFFAEVDGQDYHDMVLYMRNRADMDGHGGGFGVDGDDGEDSSDDEDCDCGCVDDWFAADEDAQAGALIAELEWFSDGESLISYWQMQKFSAPWTIYQEAEVG